MTDRETAFDLFSVDRSGGVGTPDTGVDIPRCLPAIAGNLEVGLSMFIERPLVVGRTRVPAVPYPEVGEAIAGRD